MTTSPSLTTSSTVTTAMDCDPIKKGFQGMSSQTTYNTGDMIDIMWYAGIEYAERLTISGSMYLKKYRDDSQDPLAKIAMFEDRTLRAAFDYPVGSTFAEPLFSRCDTTCNNTAIFFAWILPNDLKFSSGDPNFVIRMENYTTSRGYHQALIDDSLPFLVNGLGQDTQPSDSPAQITTTTTNDPTAIGGG